MKFKDFLKKNGKLMLIHSLELWGLFLLGYVGFTFVAELKGG